MTTFGIPCPWCAINVGRNFFRVSCPHCQTLVHSDELREQGCVYCRTSTLAKTTGEA